jgi:hypothetical protein
MLFVIVIIIIFIFFISRRKLNEKFIFHPPKKNIEEYKNLCNENCHPYIIKDNGDEIYGLLYNKNKIPDWNDNIILYSHGNAGWVGYLLHCDITNKLCDYGTVFIYDYSGYGVSTGTPSEKVVYSNIFAVWKFLINEKKVDPQKIIVYGHSLGCAISSHLVSVLISNNNILPKSLILESPFININKIANHIGSKICKNNGINENLISVLLKILVVSEFDNFQNLKYINNKLPVYILHSPLDEIIPYAHGKKLAKNTKAKFIKINGGHNNSELTNKIHIILSK